MHGRLRAFALLFLAMMAHRGRLAAQTTVFEAGTGDSMAWFGLRPMPTPAGDTALVDTYRSFRPIGDTLSARRQALAGWLWLASQAHARGYHAAGVWYVWPKVARDSLLEHGFAAEWFILFRQDELGCWHIVSDSTPISTCVARDDPNGPGAAARRNR